jgi:hypothetical protein
LVPHYWLGVFFVLSHLAAGARAVMMAHGISKAFADRFMISGAIVAGILATAIMLGMCGLRSPEVRHDLGVCLVSARQWLGDLFWDKR